MPLSATVGAASAASFGAGNTTPRLTFQAGTFTTTDTSSPSFSMAIGAAVPYRRIIVCLSFRLDTSTNPNFPTVTVAGQSCTRVTGIIQDTTTSNVTRVGSAIYLTDANVTSGTTATVAISRSGTLFTRTFAATYSIVKNNPLVAVNTQAQLANPTTFTSPKQASQVGVAVGGAGTLSTLTSFSLTGAVTSNYNSGVQEFGGLVTGVAGTGNITYTSVGTSASMYALLAVWR
jgi:hypothetical protein